MNTNQNYKTNPTCPQILPHHVDRAISTGCTLDLLIYLQKHNPEVFNRIQAELFTDLESGIYSIITEVSHTLEFEQVASLAWENWAQ